MTSELQAHPMAWVRFAALPLCALDDVMDIDAMWADPQVRDAVHLASPSLAEALVRRAGRSTADDGRLYRSLRGYYSRMAARSTPFGLLAGVFSGSLTLEKTTVTLDLSLVAHLRCEQLAMETAGLAADTIIEANPGLERAGGGFLVPPHGWLRSRQERSRYVRATATLLRVADMLEEPMSAMCAATRLAAQTGIGCEAWLSHLEHLERQNVVVRTEEIGSRSWLTTHATPRGETGAALRSRIDRQADGVEVSVDAFAVDADGAELPAELGRHAVVLCELLDLASPSPVYPAHLEAAAQDFVHRFGPGAEVQVLEVFSLLRGIPLRQPVQQCRSHDPQAPLTPREQILSAAVGAADLGTTIDDSTRRLLSQLARTDSAATAPPYAPAQEILLRPTVGTHGLASELMFAGGTSALGGRFIHLLPPRSRAAHREMIETIDRCFAPVEVAEMVVTPALAGRRVPGIAPVVAGRRRLVSIAPGALARGSDSTGADDILVGVDAETHRLYLRSARSGRRLHLAQSSMARDELMQPLEAFLLQVCRAQFRYTSPFDWGALSSRTFLPGVRVGFVYLCTPRWLLNDRDVQGDPKALRDWMARWQVPAKFVARKVGSDRGLLLRRGTDDELLLHLVRRTSPAEVEIKAAPDAPGESVIRGTAGRPHVSDVVVTVLRRQAAVTDQTTTTAAILSYPNDARFEWTAFDLSLPWAALPHFLCDHLRQWLSDATAAAVAARAWWDITQLPDPRLRVYVPAQSTEELDAAAAFWRRCRKARTRGELAGASQSEHHVYEGLVGDRRLLRLAHEFFAADALETMAIVGDAPGRSTRFALRCGTHLYRMLAESGLPWAQIRALANREERNAGRKLHTLIGRDLYGEALKEEAMTDWLERWRALAHEAGPRMGSLIGTLAGLSLNRLCVSNSLRPHIFGAVRRLVDRRVHELRSAR